MAWALIGVVGIVTIVAAGAFANKLGVAAPILLILFGVGFSFIPGAPTNVPPEIILVGLLPPILYSAAVNVPVIDFRRNFGSISALSGRDRDRQETRASAATGHDSRGRGAGQ
jgi:NhaP-type Na+/H+ or K+/H+ antiporter